MATMHHSLQGLGHAYLPRLFASRCINAMSVFGSVEYVCSKMLQAAVQVAPVHDTDTLCLQESRTSVAQMHMHTKVVT